ncbi:MAG: metallophosphoesterase [Pyrinomonadaceae bacterium]|nr:metallophosphoesterase [Pyrinomonadaceae bacterium]
MHELTGDRDAVLEMMKQTAFKLARNSQPLAKSAKIAPKAAKSGTKAAKTATTTPAQQAEIVGQLKRALAREQDNATRDDEAPAPKSANAAKARGTRPKANPMKPSESVAKALYMPRDRTVAVFQAAMDEYLDGKLKTAATPKAAKKSGGKAMEMKTATPASDKTNEVSGAEGAKADIGIFFQTPKPPARGANVAKGGALQPKSPFEKFGNLDPGWASIVAEKIKMMLRGKAKFVAHKSATDSNFLFDLPQQATIALVSDWGGGNESARSVAAQIRLRNPNYVIHLGDIYYAGTDHEVRKCFLDLWDFNSPALRRTFALNGNHEMYSGGHAYFKAIKTLGQPASYFSLRNEHWRFINLDTAYVDHDLNDVQIQWLDAQLNSKPTSAKNVLLSHHQPFSAFERANTGEGLRERVRKFTDAGKIHGWIWGHEHLCVVYDKHLGVKGRCIGHGCIPYDLPRDPQSTDVKVLWWNNRKQPPPLGGGTQGFAMLTIDGAQMRVEYIDEDGRIAKTEDNFENSATVLK